VPGDRRITDRQAPMTDIEISTDQSRLDVDRIHAFLSGESYWARGQGVGKALMRAITDHPDLQKVRRMGLLTMDAHGLYESVGFVTPTKPQMWMERECAPEHESWSGTWSYDD
jgi:predicted N-acetyltransferase YhbS